MGTAKAPEQTLALGKNKISSLSGFEFPYRRNCLSLSRRDLPVISAFVAIRQTQPISPLQSEPAQHALSLHRDDSPGSLSGIITREAAKYPEFKLVMHAQVQQLIEENGAVVGVRYLGRDGGKKNFVLS